MHTRLWASATLIGAMLFSASNIAVSAQSSSPAPLVLTAAGNQEYLSRALEDLGYARWYLTHAGDEAAPSAVAHTDQATNSVKAMMIAAHLNPKQGAPHDVVSTRSDYLYNGIKFLTKASQEINATNLPSGQRTTALTEIGLAMKAAKAGIVASNKLDQQQCSALERAVGHLGASRDELDKALAAFGTNHNDAYNDVLRVRTETSGALQELRSSMRRTCNGS